jgi:hypothetical protein
MYLMPPSRDSVSAVNVLSDAAPRIRRPRGENLEDQTLAHRPAAGSVTAGPKRALLTASPPAESPAQNHGSARRRRCRRPANLPRSASDIRVVITTYSGRDCAPGPRPSLITWRNCERPGAAIRSTICAGPARQDVHRCGQRRRRGWSEAAGNSRPDPVSTGLGPLPGRMCTANCWRLRLLSCLPMGELGWAGSSNVVDAYQSSS